MPSPLLKDFLHGDSRIFAAEVTELTIPAHTIGERNVPQENEIARYLSTVPRLRPENALAHLASKISPHVSRDFWYGFHINFPESTGSDGVIRNRHAENLLAYLAGFIYNAALTENSAGNSVRFDVVVHSLLSTALEGGSPDAGVFIKKKSQRTMLSGILHSLWLLRKAQLLPDQKIQPVLHNAGRILVGYDLEDTE